MVSGAAHFLWFLLCRSTATKAVKSIFPCHRRILLPIFLSKFTIILFIQVPLVCSSSLSVPRFFRSSILIFCSSLLSCLSAVRCKSVPLLWMLVLSEAKSTFLRCSGQSPEDRQVRRGIRLISAKLFALRGTRRRHLGAWRFKFFRRKNWNVQLIENSILPTHHDKPAVWDWLADVVFSVHAHVPQTPIGGL